MEKFILNNTQNITLHIKNTYQEGELSQEATCKEYSQVQTQKNRRNESYEVWIDLKNNIIKVNFAEVLPKLPKSSAKVLSKLIAEVLPNNCRIKKNSSTYWKKKENRQRGNNAKITPTPPK